MASRRKWKAATANLSTFLILSVKSNPYQIFTWLFFLAVKSSKICFLFLNRQDHSFRIGVLQKMRVAFVLWQQDEVIIKVASGQRVANVSDNLREKKINTYERSQ